MRRESIKMLMFFVVWAKFCSMSLINAQTDENTWVDPDAWSRDHQIIGSSLATNNKCCKCSDNAEPENFIPVPPHKEQTLSEDSASLIYFKKFISILFDRKNFKYDSSQQIYKRSIDFIIKSYQMEKLEQLQDPRDLDSILTEVFNNVQTPNMYCDGQRLFHISEKTTEIKTIILNLIYDMLQLIKTSEIRFLLVAAIVIIVAWIINNRYKIGWIPLIFVGVFIYGYLHTYLECNRELEVKEMLEILNHDNTKENKSKFSHVITYFKGIFYSDDDDEHQNIKKSAKLSLGFCRPDHVLLMYFNDLFIKYLEVLVEQCAVVLKNLNASLYFPFNLLSTPIFLCLIAYIIKLMFKYVISPTAWVQFMHRKKSHHPEEAAIKIEAISQGDRISGDNLKLLLNAINFTPQRITDMTSVAPATTVSGVEEVREDTEPNFGKLLQKRDKSPVEKSKINTNENSLVEKNKFKVEDYLPEKS